MAFNTGGAATGAASTGITAFSATGDPLGGLAGAAIGGVLGGLTGGSKQTNSDVGFSSNTQERSQRINQSQQQQQASQQQIAQDLQNYFLTGQYNQTWNNIPNGGSYGNPYSTAPKGPVGTALQFGLNSEQDLSGKRQNIAMGLLGQWGRQYDAANAFAGLQLKYGSDAIGAQSQLYRDSINQSNANTALQGQIFDSLGNSIASGDRQAQANNAIQGNLFGSINSGIESANQQTQANNYLQGTLFGSINDHIASGGQASAAQQQNISNIYNAQRYTGQSNLGQQYGDALRQLQDHATSRGLRFGDTPIQDRGNLTTQEYLRNAANLEASIGGNQANALLQMPFQQQGQNLQALGQVQANNLNQQAQNYNAFGQAQANNLNQQGQNFQALGQAQGSNLNVLNSFSTPINQAFTQQGQQFQQGQFAAQYSPASYAGIPLQNLNAYLSGGSYAQPNVSYAAPTPAPFQPSFASNFANSFGSSLGTNVGQGVSGALGGLTSQSNQPTQSSAISWP